MPYYRKIQIVFSMCLLYPALLFGIFFYYKNMITKATANFQTSIQKFSEHLIIQTKGKYLYIAINTHKNNNYLAIWKRIVKSNIFIVDYKVNKKMIHIQAIPEGFWHRNTRPTMDQNNTEENVDHVYPNCSYMHLKKKSSEDNT